MPQDRRSDRPAAPSDWELLSLAAHEFRTPASVAGGYLRMLLKDAEYPLSERQRKMIDEADKACMRMVAIAAELSEIAKLDADTAAIARTSFDLFPALDETASQASEARDRGVQLQVSGESEGAHTAGDRPRLQQAFAARQVCSYRRRTCRRGRERALQCARTFQ